MMPDFSENYSFVLQDAAKSFHWNNSQATIHPFVAYYMKSGELHCNEGVRKEYFQSELKHCFSPDIPGHEVVVDCR